MNKTQLLEVIAEIIKDYRHGEIDPITFAHVEKWVDQFDADDRLTILTELGRILKRFYCSRTRFESAISAFLASEEVFGSKPKVTLAKVNFLRLQKTSKSKTSVLEVIDKILKTKYNLSVSQCGGADLYVYSDDCVFTGNQFRSYAVTWLEQNAPTNSTLIAYHIGSHTSGFRYAEKYIDAAAKQKNISFRSYAHINLDNGRDENSAAQFMWPIEFADESVTQYCQKLKEAYYQKHSGSLGLFRNPIIPIQENVFSSVQARNVVEKAFLKVGVKIATAAQRPNQAMRPLGFDKLHTLGFGSLFITCRNIANSCPLALWYGDPNYSPNHPLGQWYPLFLRKGWSPD